MLIDSMVLIIMNDHYEVHNIYLYLQNKQFKIISLIMLNYT